MHSNPFRSSIYWLSTGVFLLLMSGCGVKDTPSESPSDSASSQINQNANSIQQFGDVEFKDNSGWLYSGNVTLGADKRGFVSSKGQTVILNQGNTATDTLPSDLITASDFQDLSMSFEFNITDATQSGVYLLGRYRINISNIYEFKRWWPGWMGGLHPRFDDDREWKQYDGVAATANPSKAPGAWQKLEIAFKAPRFDKNGFKSSYAEFIEVKFNGVTIHQNQIATGPSHFSIAQDESTSGPIVILGGNGNIALKNLKITPKDYSNMGSLLAVKEEHRVPLGPSLGKPMFNQVGMGKNLFLNKGCKECHEVSPSADSVKTGPKLYGVFRPKAKALTVFDSAEQHTTSILADEDYFVDSLRQPIKHLAIRKMTDGEEKQFLPIMPAFNADAISESEASALLAYLASLNTDNEKGSDYIWLEHPEKPYVLNEDLTAELVGQVPRLARVNIGDAVSGRAYHVGLPNHMNYSFDPRTLAIEMVWSGRFLSLKNEKQGRADAPSEPGKQARIWPSSTIRNLFQPLLASGEAVDMSFKEPPRSNMRISNELLLHKTDFKDEIAKVDASFFGVDTPKGQIPTFHYRVNQNEISLQFGLSPDRQLQATFNFDNKTTQSLYIGGISLSDIEVSSGKIIDDKWVVDEGKYQNVTFTATVEGAPKYAELTDPVLNQENLPQPLVWSDANGKVQSLPKGFTLQNASVPTDKFGRKILFEPLGIAFNSAGEAYVSTRTAGVWKVKNNHWQQFAEGIFGSLGVIIDSDNAIVIGEKPGLTRLIDKDADGWAESRQLVTDQFRFNSNYHEYLHGPALGKDGAYWFTLNLGHGLPGGYADKGSMSTNGGYRGWALKVDAQGNTIPVADGLRSPAGLAVHNSGTVYYTDNQGDYFGTSKLHRIKPGAYYGHPAGLVDRSGMVMGNDEIRWENVKDTRDLAIGLLPHSRAMNSPGSPVWDESDNQFGPYSGQMFVGDQSQSNIFRVHIETVNGVEQSALLPFVNGTSSGAMRLTFSPVDNSLWIGQTGRGWWAKGGSISALQRVVYDGNTVPQSMHSIDVLPNGYQINFTQPISDKGKASFSQLKLSSWYYLETEEYGSEEIDGRSESVEIVGWSDDAKSVQIQVADFTIDPAKPAEQTSRVYEFDLADTAFAKGLDPFHVKAWYTLNAIPAKY